MGTSRVGVHIQDLTDCGRGERDPSEGHDPCGSLLALLSTSSFAPGTIPVVITSAAEEKMAKRLASVVEKQLKKDSRFTRVEQVPPGMLTITLPSGVGWERRLDWTEIHYQARLTSVDGRTRVITGICWNWNLPACAKQILDAAAQLQSN